MGSKRVEIMKSGALEMNAADEGLRGIVLQSDSVEGSDTSNQPKKKRTMKDILATASAEDSRAVITGMRLVQNEFDHREKRDLLTLNMNNSDALSKMSESEQLKMMFLIGHSIAETESGNGIDRVSLCNVG